MIDPFPDDVSSFEVFLEILLSPISRGFKSQKCKLLLEAHEIVLYFYLRKNNMM